MPVNCDRFEELISVHLSGEIADDTNGEFLEHRASCAKCSALLRDQICADGLLRASLSSRTVPAQQLQDRVRQRIDRPSWWLRLPNMRALQVVFASVVLLAVGLVVTARWRSGPAVALLESAAADHVEDVVTRVRKTGWTTRERDAESLAETILGDARSVRAFAPVGYSFARARACNLENKSQTWLHLIYGQGDREISFFVRGRQSPLESPGQAALNSDPRPRQIDGYEVAGVREGAFGVIFVGAVDRAEAARMALTAARSIS